MILDSVAIWYKNDMPGGFALSMKNNTSDTHSKVERSNEMIRTMEEGDAFIDNWMIGDNLTVHQMSQLLIEELECELIPTMNKHMYASPIRPDERGVNDCNQGKWEMTSEFWNNWMEAMVRISWLIDNGAIEDDRNNGVDCCYHTS